MREPTIVYEDARLLMLDKPAGLLVHPSPQQTRGTLTQWLAHRYPDIARLGDRPIGHGIVHRLDRDVSGVLVVAKTQAAYDELKRLFTEGAVEKHYQALVYGQPQDDAGTIEKRIAGTSGRRKTIRDDSRPALLAQSQQALTHWRVLARYDDSTLLDVQPVTGRTHQIRVHLASIGHHVVCDPIYAERKPCMGLKRPFLHAAELTVPLADGAVTATAPLPQKLAAVIDEREAA